MILTMVSPETNLITLYRNCHRRLHDNAWELFRCEKGVRVVDKKTGDQVMRPLSNSGLDVPILL